MAFVGKVRKSKKTGRPVMFVEIRGDALTKVVDLIKAKQEKGENVVICTNEDGVAYIPDFPAKS